VVARPRFLFFAQTSLRTVEELRLDGDRRCDVNIVRRILDRGALRLFLGVVDCCADIPF